MSPCVNSRRDTFARRYFIHTHNSNIGFTQMPYTHTHNRECKIEPSASGLGVFQTYPRCCKNQNARIHNKNSLSASASGTQFLQFIDVRAYVCTCDSSAGYVLIRASIGKMWHWILCFYHSTSVLFCSCLVVRSIKSQRRHGATERSTIELIHNTDARTHAKPCGLPDQTCEHASDSRRSSR